MTDGGMACFFCVLYGCPQLRGLQFQAVCFSLCVSLMSLFGHARWGRGCTWADWQQVSQQVPSSAPAEAAPPPPPSPQDTGLSTGF